MSRQDAAVDSDFVITAGLMGELARAVDDAGGKTIGIIPKALAAREVSDVMRQPENEIVVETMHERKQLMAHLCDGFIALPGGCVTVFS